MLDLIFIAITVLFFVIGEARVNVLLLNFALDEQKPMSRQFS